MVAKLKTHTSHSTQLTRSVYRREAVGHVEAHFTNKPRQASAQHKRNRATRQTKRQPLTRTIRYQLQHIAQQQHRVQSNNTHRLLDGRQRHTTTNSGRMENAGCWKISVANAMTMAVSVSALMAAISEARGTRSRICRANGDAITFNMPVNKHDSTPACQPPIHKFNMWGTHSRFHLAAAQYAR